MLTSAVYVGLCAVWVPRESLVERAVLPDDVFGYGGDGGGEEGGTVEGDVVEGGKGGM